jgi:hypothetical protein
MTRLLLVVALIVLVTAVYAESDTANQVFKLGVNEVAEVSVVTAGATGTPAFTLTIDNPAIGGDIPADVSNSATKVRYTSIVADANGTSLMPTRKLDVYLSDGVVPGGCDLTVSATAPGVDLAKGQMGIAGTGGVVDGATNLTAKELVTGIGNCYTGIAAGDGAAITWTLSVVPAQIAALKTAGGAEVTATYTLRDAL